VRRPLLIRADASAEIGTGHVMRCLALAQAWQDAGGTAHIGSASLPPRLERRLRSEGLTLHRLGDSTDAAEISAVVDEVGPEWVVLDGYAFTGSYQAAVRRRANLLVIDDFGTTGSCEADLLLDQNLGSNHESYAALATHTTTLFGPRFCLLRREFRARTPEADDRDSDPLQVLVLTGGGNGATLREAALSALAALEGPRLRVQVVVGPGEGEEGSSGTASEGEPTVTLVRDPADLSQLMASASAAISAAGSTVWELLYLGVPSVLVPVARNQRRIAEALDAVGAALAVPEPQALPPAVKFFREGPGWRAGMRRRGRSIVDGRGAQRVVSAMTMAPAGIVP
jgi:UDP-2,4-diacetamido-2,4,6-trideoxy-beta-L-altropyranose hydrolase